MSTPLKRIAGAVLVVLGVAVMVGSQRIVFPGLEVLLGIETIVGRENVFYPGDGTYLYTNPGAMIRWIATVFVIGLFVTAGGGVLLCGHAYPGDDLNKGTAPNFGERSRWL